jgi:uncharacterized SAM-binding protein YcdF (DUF218 family)
MNDYQVVQRFLTLRGRAYRPESLPTRARPATERAARQALIPHFRLAALGPLLEAAGEAASELTERDLGGLDGRRLAARALTRLEGASEADARALVAAIGRAHRGLIMPRRAAAPPPDLIACPGSRTLTRLVTAFELWKRAGANIPIAVCGGVASYDDGPARHKAVREGDAYAACLRLWGVPPELIEVERESSTTAANAAHLLDLARARADELGRPPRLLLTTAGFHSTRFCYSVKQRFVEGGFVAVIGGAAAPCFDTQTLTFDCGGRPANDKLAIVMNEYLKLHFELCREVTSR